AMIPLLPNSIIVRLSTLLTMQDSSMIFRLYVWDGAIKMVRDYFVTGIGLGPGSFAFLYPNYANLHAQVGVPHSHMVYMELVIELGILGFFSFMWFMLRLWKDSACALLKTSCMTNKLVLIASLSSLLGIAFAFGVEYVWYYPRTFFTYFILAGIATAAIRITKNENRGCGKSENGENS
ncbi:MAG: O-antigen ligase family protein, partial [Oscillospiraceae bacterium]